jgi:hypothetical protein
MDLKQEIKQLMRQVRSGRMPASAAIVEETFRILRLNQIPPPEIRRNFNKLLLDVWRETLVVLERHEESAYSTGIPKALIEKYSEDIEKAKSVAQKNGFEKGLVSLLGRWYPRLREIFLSIGQSRKARGGRDFELQFGKLLELAGIPYQKVNRATRVDFMIPSDQAFQKNRTTAVIASAKRTLRERWREVVEELKAMQSPNIFLVTADENISLGQVKDISGHNIHVVVWDQVKEKKFPKEPLVLGYTEWINGRLPVFEKLWG